MRTFISTLCKQWRGLRVKKKNGDNNNNNGGVCVCVCAKTRQKGERSVYYDFLSENKK